MATELDQACSYFGRRCPQKGAKVPPESQDNKCQFNGLSLAALALLVSVSAARSVEAIVWRDPLDRGPDDVMPIMTVLSGALAASLTSFLRGRTLKPTKKPLRNKTTYCQGSPQAGCYQWNTQRSRSGNESDLDCSFIYSNNTPKRNESRDELNSHPLSARPQLTPNRREPASR